MGGVGVEFPTFPLTYAVALKTLWHVQSVIVTLVLLLLLIMMNVMIDDDADGDGDMCS